MIKSVAKKSKNPTTEYPCIMITSDASEIVLFNSIAQGVIIKSKEAARLGYYSNSWFMKHFTPWYGTITLTQEN